MTQWQDRKTVGDLHEHRVAAALRNRGWTVHPCGQGTYPQAIRNALRHTRSALRQFPDLIAARGSDIVTIDAKDHMPSTTTNRYAISTTTINAGLQLTALHAPTPFTTSSATSKSSPPPKSSTTPTTPTATPAAPTTSSPPTTPTTSTTSSAPSEPELPEPGTARRCLRRPRGSTRRCAPPPRCDVCRCGSSVLKAEPAVRCSEGTMCSLCSPRSLQLGRQCDGVVVPSRQIDIGSAVLGVLRRSDLGSVAYSCPAEVISAMRTRRLTARVMTC